MKKNMKKNMMLLSLMAAAIMTPLSATAQTRIAVVSDIHVMDPSLLPEEKGEGTPWDTYYKGQRKMLEQSAGLFDQFINAMKSEAPDVLLITGDLTKDGEEDSHQYVIDKLDELKTALPNIKIYVIPGNHDFGEETLGNDPTKGASKLSTSFASYYAAYGYTGSACNGDSYIAQIDNDLYLLAIDSHSGKVSQATLEWIQNWIQNNASGKRVIAMMHHPLFPHITGADLFIDTYAVKYQPTTGNATTYETVRNELINAGVNVILTGHFHTSDIAYDWKDNQANGIYDINTGSLISYPCDYRMLTLSADKKTLSVKTKSLTETPALIPSGYESWKTWLEDRVRSIAATKFNSFPYNMSGLTDDEKVFLSKTAADAFSLHAEGNENTKEASTDLLKDYTDYSGTSTYYSTVKSALSLTFSSMLEDKSNYGNDHANQTADRAIVIDLTDPSNLLLELDNNDDNNSVINYYNGKTATVTLTGRTLFKDGKWNTICLPFNVTDGDANESNEVTGGTDGKTFTGTPLEDADIRELSTTIVNDGKTTGFNTETNSLILNFTAQEAVTKIEAGKPYIVKWTGGTDITDPSFSGVTINNKAPEGVTSKDGSITFIGTYGWQKFTDENKRILLIGKNTSKSTLFYPESGASLGAFRAYFQLADGYTAGEPDTPEPGTSEIRNFVLNFGDDDSATGIIAIGDSQLSTLNAQRSEWFTLDGRRLAAKPTAKGIYLHEGRKVVIK